MKLNLASSTLNKTPYPSHFTLEWKGYFLATETEIYNFEISNDDGSYLWIDTDFLDSATNHTSNNITMNNGGLYIRVSYFHYHLFST